MAEVGLRLIRGGEGTREDKFDKKRIIEESIFSGIFLRAREREKSI